MKFVSLQFPTRCGFVFVTILSVTLAAHAQPAATQSTRATTKPTTRSTTSPTTTTASVSTPAELIEKMKQRRASEQSRAQVAYFDLTQPIVEKPADFSFFGEGEGVTLRSLVARLRKAKDDSKVRAVLISLGNAGLGLAQAQEVRDALLELRKVDKRTFVYADSYDTTMYTLATGATDICLLEGGEIMMPGVSGEATFAKGLLDKIGVQADYIQIGEFKGADEQLTRTEPSNELRGEINKLFDAMYDQIVDGISTQRKLSNDVVKEVIDNVILSAADAKEKGFVDHLVDQDGLRALIKEQVGAEIDLDHDYGEPKREAIDMSNPFALLSMLSKRPEAPRRDSVAIIYADGMIVDGKGGAGLFGSAVGSEEIRQSLRIAARDETIKAVVIRIDSPGGSALASEVMWQAARKVTEKKPLIISIGNMAASGGYYLASAGDHIYADPAAIVGSIGVVGGKFVSKDLFDKLGITTENFSRGRNANLFSSEQPFTDEQRALVKSWMTRTYEQFTSRVMTTRKGKIADIDAVARGRIFLARQAKDLGMVDELGGIQDATIYAASKAGMKGGSFEVRILPQPKTLADFFGGGASSAATPLQTITPSLGDNSVLRMLGPQARRGLMKQAMLFQLLEQRPVALVAPFSVNVN